MSVVLSSRIRRPCTNIFKNQLLIIPVRQGQGLSLSTKTRSGDDELVRRRMIEKIIRVDHAGEMGASYIYQGKIIVLLLVQSIFIDYHLY